MTSTTAVSGAGTSLPFELTIKKMNRVMDEMEAILTRKQR